jgi:hypothetical protein
LHGKAILGCREGVRCRLVWGSVHGRVKGGQPGGLHRKAILGCYEEGMWRRPVRGSAHGRVEGRLGGGTSGGACGGASDDYGGPRTSGARTSACGGANGGDSVQEAKD